MESFSLVPGTPVRQLIFPRAKADSLTGYEPNRPRSPRGQNNPYRAASPAAPIRPPGIPGDRVPFCSSLIYLDERIHRQVGQEEETAAKRLYEVNQYHLYEERESALRRELEEIQFEEEISLQARQHLQHWEQEEAAAFTVRVQAAESNIAQAATLRLLTMEEEAIQHHQHLRQSLTQAGHSYRTTVQQEARIYSEELHQELQYHQTAQAQAESLLAAERQRAEHTLLEQANQWQSALRNVSEWGETAVEQERSENVEQEVQLNIFRLELQEAHEELRNWDDWYSSGVLPEAETSLDTEEEEGSPSLPAPAISEQVQGTSSPLTPPVLQSQPLLAQHLPPPVLPFQNFASRVAETALEREVVEEQQAARRILEESEEQASHSHSATVDELEQARQTIRPLEQGQVGTGAPSFTPTLTPQMGGFTSQLTLGQPVPALPAGNSRAPWAATRETLQQQGSAPPTPLLQQQHQGIGSVSSGLPSLSGVGSVPGVSACPIFASPSPHTPHACLYPHSQIPQVNMPAVPQDEGKIDFKREKSALPKLNIKGGDATSITRTIHEWLQRTSIALNTWSASAVQLWHNAVALAKAAHNQWTLMAPAQRALQTGLPSTGHALPAQLSVLEAIMRSDLCNHC